MSSTAQNNERTAGHVTASNYSRRDLDRMAREEAASWGSLAKFKKWDLRIHQRGVTLIVTYTHAGETCHSHIAL